MNIFITGGNGYVAREIIIDLLAEGHTVTACVRNTATCVLAAEKLRYVVLDFQNSTSASDWTSHVAHQDIVINCVGVFQTRTPKEMWDIHCNAPKALFDACVSAGVKKIIQISALGIDQSDVDYARSKLAAENHLHSLSIDSVIIRPSFVYGASSYGGSSLFRGLASLPFFIFLPGSGEQLLQPIHVHDLTKIVCQSLLLNGKHLLCAVGSEKLSLRSILNKLRAWLGFGKAKNIAMPFSLIRLTAKFGDFFRNSPLSSTGVKLMVLDNVVPDEAFETLTKTVGFTPRGFSDGLNRMVSGVQDRWHARLFFLRPALRLSLAFLWVATGIVSVIFATTFAYPILNAAHIPPVWQDFLCYSASLIDCALGLALLCNYRVKLTAAVQLLFMLIFTGIITVMMPAYWLHPFGPVTKNIPLLIATLIMMAIESDR